MGVYLLNLKPVSGTGTVELIKSRSPSRRLVGSMAHLVGMAIRSRCSAVETAGADFYNIDSFFSCAGDRSMLSPSMNYLLNPTAPALSLAPVLTPGVGLFMPGSVCNPYAVPRRAHNAKDLADFFQACALNKCDMMESVVLISNRSLQGPLRSAPRKAYMDHSNFDYEVLFVETRSAGPTRHGCQPDATFILRPQPLEESQNKSKLALLRRWAAMWRALTKINSAVSKKMLHVQVIPDLTAHGDSALTLLAIDAVIDLSQIVVSDEKWDEAQEMVKDILERDKVEFLLAHRLQCAEVIRRVLEMSALGPILPGWETLESVETAESTYNAVHQKSPLF